MQIKSLYLIVIVLFCLAVSDAQEYPKYEVFIGYSHLGPGNLQGWQASGAYNFNRWAGVKLDADGHYFNGSTRTAFASLHERMHEVVIGPQLSWRQKRTTLFAHILVGYSRFNQVFRNRVAPLSPISSIETSNDDLVFVVGGGGDINLGHRWAWRLEADELKAERLTNRFNNFRFSSGLVIRLGSRK